MAKNRISAGTKRPRKERLYENKGKIQALLGFDTEASFDEWQESPMVKPWWDTYVKETLEKGQDKGKKVLDEDSLLKHIRVGEKFGQRKYLAARTSPTYESAEDYHAWLVFWLAAENSTDRNGCFWSKALKQHEAWSAMHKFVLWAKRQRHRGSLSTPKKPKRAITKVKDPDPEEPLLSDTDDEDLDPEKGIAVVTWVEGVPEELDEEDNLDRVFIKQLCSHTMLTFWKAVEDAFDLPKFMQRRIELGAANGSTFREAQAMANKSPNNKKIHFYLKTEPASIPEEAQSEPNPTNQTNENDAVREFA
ncbi:hypothetical protein N0V95_001698 [Ascochyta clinopodiicola]|nr:hypothetical protein N0V95_001698 [Ascochyta clinopodiicola]